MGVDARGFPGGLLRLNPAFAYVEPPSSWPLPWAECLTLAPNTGPPGKSLQVWFLWPWSCWAPSFEHLRVPSRLSKLSPHLPHFFVGRRVRVLIEDLSLVWRLSASASGAMSQPWLELSSLPLFRAGSGIFLTHLGGAGAGWEQASLWSIYGNAEQGPWEAFLLLKISSARSFFFFN